MKGVRVRAPFFVSGRGWRCWPILRDTFGADPPAATMIECGLIDPKYGIEIEVTALLPGQVTFCPLDGAGEIGHIGPKVSEAKMGILNTLLRAATWWNGQTLNTQLWTWRKGVKVGEDDQGNIYYRTADDARRWVIFNGEAEASRVSPEWHGWLHRTWDTPPTDMPLPHKVWERPHQENLTGTALAYAPAGSIRREKPADRADYEAWSPE